MAAYLIGEMEVHDHEAYEEYKKLVSKAVEKYGGKYLVRGGTVKPLEGNWNPKRLVLIEFDSMEAAEKWYNSDEYKPAIKIRKNASSGKSIFVDGV